MLLCMLNPALLPTRATRLGKTSSFQTAEPPPIAPPKNPLVANRFKGFWGYLVCALLIVAKQQQIYSPPNICTYKTE